MFSRINIWPLVLALAVVFSAAGQQAEATYPYYTDSLLASDFLLKAEISLAEKELDSAIFFGNNALAIAESKAIRSLIARSSIVIGDSYKQKGQFASSLNHYLIALREFEVLGKKTRSIAKQ